MCIIEHIIKTGSQDFIDKMKEERGRLKNLESFSYEEDGIDRGNSSKSKILFNINFNIKFFLIKLETRLNI